MSELPYAYTGDTQRQHRAEEPRQVEIPSCTLVQDLIPLYLDGEVSPESHVLIGDHIQQCERCSGYLAGARSVRAQILHDQQAVRAATSAGPTVAQVRQPISNGLGVRLWQTLMVLTYLGSQFVAFVGFAEGEPGAIFAGGFITVFTLIGLIMSHSLRTKVWRGLMWLTGAMGVLVAPISAVNGMPGAAVYGIGLMLLAAWGLWLGQTQPSSGTTQPLKTGSNKALLTAALSILIALGCAGMAGIGMLLLLLERDADAHTIGAGMVLVGGVGLLLVNQRRGWVPALATTLTVQQVLGYALIGGGLLLIAVLAQGLMYNLLPALLVLGIGGGLATLGYRLIRPS